MSRLSLIILLSFSLLLTGGTVASAATGEPSRPVSNRVDGPLAPGEGGGSTRKVALGVAQPNGRDLTALDALSESIGGRMPAIWAVWSQWGLPGTREFPAKVAEGLAARGVTPMIWWEPVDPRDKSDPTYPRHRNISRGDHDAYIRRFARDARAFGGTILLRLAHEANGSYFPWSVERFDNSPATFVAAWRHVHRLFAEEGATNVRFLWSVAKQSCSGGCNPYTAVYPGDAYVDILGMSTHNWGAMKDNWVSMYDGVKRVARHLAAISDKPLVIAEMASNGEGGDKPAWIREGYREVYERIPRIAAIVYLDADLRKFGHPDWRLSSPAKALTAYAEIAALRRFTTSAPFGSLKATTIKVMRAKADERKQARKSNDRKQASKSSESSAKAPVKRSPKVRKGAAPSDGPKATAKATTTSNRSTKRKGQAVEEPTATLDSFSR